MRKEFGFWKEWNNLEPVLREAMEQNHGLIPGRKYWNERRMSSIPFAIANYHGGMNVVRQRLGVSDLKWCPGCEKILTRSQFRIRSSTVGQIYRDNICKVCNSSRVAQYRRTQIGKVAEMIRSSKHRAKVANIAFELTREWALQRLNDIDWKCEVTGIPFEWSPGGSAFNHPYALSLDRIDSQGGYTCGNVQMVLCWVNWQKKALTMPEFIHLCEAVAQTARARKEEGR